MEYSQMFPFLIDYLPISIKLNKDFVSWLSQDQLMQEFAAMIMMVLPGDRLSYYQTSDVA